MSKRPRRVKVRKRSKPQALSTELPHIGSLSAPVYMIIDPMVGDLKSKVPLKKPQMEWLAERAAKHGGFRKSDVCVISACPPVTAECWSQGKLINAHLKEWRDEVLKLINANDPKFIMPYGAKACAQVFGKQVQITKVRGQPIQDYEKLGLSMPILPMLSPFYAQRQPENEAAFIADMETAGRIYKAGFDIDASAIDYKHDYQWCYDLEWLIKKKPKRLSVDVETVGLIPFDPKTRLLCVQLCWEEGKAVNIPIEYDKDDLRHHGFIPWKKGMKARLVKQLRKLLENPKIEVFGQNFKFDFQMLYYKLGITVANYAHETMLLAHLYDENQRRINLNDLVKMHVPQMAGFNDHHEVDPDHHQKSRMDLFPPDKMLDYACGDVDATWRLLDALIEKVGEDQRQWDCYRYVTMPGQQAFCHIEHNGFPVSKIALRQFQNKLRIHQKKERVYLLRQIPKSIKNKWRDSGVGLKVTRRAILQDWLYDHPDGLRLKPMAWTKTKQPSVSSKEALPYYVADYPVIQRLIDYIKNDKMLNTYAKGFWKYIYDDMIRPSYSLTGTVTGRSSSKDPNGQNFPKRGKMAKEYRRVFQAPPGWVFLSCDLSQAELRIAAMMSGDDNMLKVYAEGGDIHRTTAAGTMGISVEEFKALPADIQGLKRFQAKAVNFGFLYGMWWVKFRSYAKTEYGIDFTEEEAREIRENFFRTYPMLEYWHEDVQNIVSKKGYIRTFDGRIRHLPNVFSDDEGVAKQAMRQGINSPVQSIASDLGIMTLGRLIPHLRETGKDKWIKPCGFIHDAIVCLVREDKVGAGARLVKGYMENNPLEEWFGWEPEIPIVADAEIGRTLAETIELDPEQFMQRGGSRKTFANLVAEEKAKIVAKRDKEDDAEKRAKLDKEIAALDIELGMTRQKPSKPKVKSATLNRKRSNTHAKTKRTQENQNARGGVRKTVRRIPRSGQRSQSKKDRVA